MTQRTPRFLERLEDDGLDVAGEARLQGAQPAGLILAVHGLTCEKAADADDNGMLELNDPIILLDHLFLGGPRPPPPAIACGADPTPDSLVCDAASPCA